MSIFCVLPTFLFLLLATRHISGQQLTFTNPIIETNSADPAVLKLGDYYYLTLSDNRETELTIYKSPVLTDFRNAERVIAHKCAPGFSDLWASEMHLVNGDLYIYFTMRGEITDNGHRMYVLKGNNSSDPMAGWSDPIRLVGYSG
jgi:GH43 family beta-xylosidase